MIYLNNAATTYPKPSSVLQAQATACLQPPLSQYRSVEILAEEDVFTRCRKNVAELMGLARWEHIYFASGATDALNRLLGGLNLQGKRVITTQTEHNSVLRPLFNNEGLRQNVEVVPCNPLGRVDPEEVRKVLEVATQASVSLSLSPLGNTYAGLFILNHCSNVTGMVQSVAQLSEMLHRYGFLLLLDVSQSAGCIPIMADEWQLDMLAFTGHKSLFGPQGTGGYYVREGLPFKPVQFGGTGRDSSRLTYEDGDYEYEVGTQNTVGIAGLNAGVEYVLHKGVNRIMAQEREKMCRLYDELSAIPSVILYGNKNENLGPLLSFNLRGMKPSDVAYILQHSYRITLRSGLHCAPLIHKAMGTDSYGCLRVSISDMTTFDELAVFVQAVREISASLP